VDREHPFRAAGLLRHELDGGVDVGDGEVSHRGATGSGGAGLGAAGA
jgi:hypothetical protein